LSAELEYELSTTITPNFGSFNEDFKWQYTDNGITWMDTTSPPYQPIAAGYLPSYEFTWSGDLFTISGSLLGGQEASYFPDRSYRLAANLAGNIAYSNVVKFIGFT
jgi:hypothetical protein